MTDDKKPLVQNEHAEAEAREGIIRAHLHSGRFSECAPARDAIAFLLGELVRRGLDDHAADEAWEASLVGHREPYVQALRAARVAASPAALAIAQRWHGPKFGFGGHGGDEFVRDVLERARQAVEVVNRVVRLEQPTCDVCREPAGPVAEGKTIYIVHEKCGRQLVEGHRHVQPEQAAWLVERLVSTSPTGQRPEWLTHFDAFLSSRWTWTQLANDAIRFSRREDAERLARVLMDYGAFPSEHIWVPPPHDLSEQPKEPK